MRGYTEITYHSCLI